MPSVEKLAHIITDTLPYSRVDFRCFSSCFKPNTPGANDADKFNLTQRNCLSSLRSVHVIPEMLACLSPVEDWLKEMGLCVTAYLQPVFNFLLTLTHFKTVNDKFKKCFSQNKLILHNYFFFYISSST